MRTPAYNIFYAMQTSQLCIDGQQIIYKGVLNLGGHVHIHTLAIKNNLTDHSKSFPLNPFYSMCH